MQELLLRLQKFWTDRGAMVVQPYNTEVGAGTGNPATMLRVLGPEPWTVGYVEPSVRPDDARYGENPNRLQTHTQFQVILKPDPGNPQEIYLQSLEALGVDIRSHDIRFVEDNWASPALGAWGLGWEVWLDGLEITQFTYFQQAGGLTLDPVSVEITYGIERIVMALQKVNHFKNIAYAPGISYGEVFGQAEYEMSRYYLDDADIDTNKELLADYNAEAQRMLDARLPIPAYNYVLRSSHTFNVLDARGAISTTERAAAFARMRTLTRGCAQLWDERRAELGHPLGEVKPLPATLLPAELPTAPAPATLLFEIGVEELPHAELYRVTDAVRSAVQDKLAATRLEHGDVRADATPRRIVVTVDQVHPREPDAERKVKGPKVSAAFDADGNPTKAAQGFARGQGVDVADLQRLTIDGTEHVGLLATDTGRDAVAVLSELLAEVVHGLRAERNMRWRDAGLAYARPVRWLLALLGEVEVPVAVSSVPYGRTTRVHRTAPQPEVTVPSADGYADFLAGHQIVLSTAERRAQIVDAATDLAAGVGGTVDARGEAALIDQVAALVEKPTAVLGNFDPRYLELPEAILTTVMRKHQRYLPVRGADGALLPHFVAVANGDCDRELVAEGFAAVLRARYEDAAFFFRADQTISPAEHKTGLGKLTFAEGLGSMADRADRIAALATVLADRAGLDEADRVTLARAGELAKFDLATSMVIELSSLAGTMAAEYASAAGEPQSVAQALADMERPRSAGGELPTSAAGAVLALADRLDLLAGLFGTGAKATGSSDPFGLRRAALGVIAILRDRPELAGITLESGLREAAGVLAGQQVSVSADALAQAHEFAVRRYEQAVLDGGADHRRVQAVLPLADAPAVADRALADLDALAGQAEFADLAAALQRARRIVAAAGEVSADYDAGKLTEPAETALHQVFSQVRQNWNGGTVAEFAAAAAPLTPAVNTFFDQILVNADDPQLRAARLGLLAAIGDFADGVVDWQALAA
ncbi:glycine--tRNA ligase [Nakamurella aerolata]|uniref:Multifunctional fusion protein n=1 Tax=Nakamurella aerolata TaxID=1656892 RepID=A0A849AD47_9ACTN|nr:glycine--tRNA ligase [Nakamurella aerolata]NNG37506.1 glycine--tRNA ligase [Nakamurella aerolata]